MLSWTAADRGTAMISDLKPGDELEVKVLRVDADSTRGMGALDAHLQLLNGENLPWRLMNMVNKLRTSLLIVFAAYIGFIIAGFSLVGLADDSPMLALMTPFTA